jgi:hypothetical protein
MTHLQDRIARLCDEYGLVALYVFGSRAAEVSARVGGRPATPEHPASDVDIVEPLCGAGRSGRAIAWR